MSHVIIVYFVCSSEKLFRTMTDLVISEGYAAAGYEYINVDDCWLDFARSYDGRLQPDAKRFPRGMADLSAYVSTLCIVNNKYYRIINIYLICITYNIPISRQSLNCLEKKTLLKSDYIKKKNSPEFQPFEIIMD